MTPEEKKKWEILQESKRIFKEEQRKKNEAIEHAKMMQKYDRMEKDTEEVKDSIGNQLKFGANMVKFEPPVRKGGWWEARSEQARFTRGQLTRSGL